MTEKDINRTEYDIYPFLALSRGLLEREKYRAYGVKHFGTIAHLEMKLFWGVVLFKMKAASPEIVRFLRAALESKEQSKIISGIVGPGFFEDFKKQVKEYPLKSSCDPPAHLKPGQQQ